MRLQAIPQSVHSMSQTKRVALLSGIFALGFSTFAWLSWSTIRMMDFNGPVYQEVIAGNDFNADILPPPGFIVETAMLAERIKQAKTADEFANIYSQMQRLQQEYDQSISRWTKQLTGKELRQTFLEEAQTPVRQFFTVVNEQLIPALKAGDAKKAYEITDRQLQPLYQKHYEAITRCVDLNASQLADYKNQAHEAVKVRQTSMLIALALVGVGTCLATWYILRGIKSQEADNVQLRQIFQHGTGMVFADSNGVVRFINPAMNALVSGVEQELSVTANQLFGQPVRSLFPRSVRLSSDGTPNTSSFAIGPQSFEVTASEIRHLNGQRSGTLYNWSCTTEQLNQRERELSQNRELAEKVEGILKVVNAASLGDLTQPVTIKGRDAVGQIGQSLSNFLDKLRDNLRMIAQSATVLSSASNELSTTSQQMTEVAGGTATKVSEASATSNQLNANMDCVSSSIQQLQSAVQEIADNAATAASISKEAVTSVDTANSTIQELNASSVEIGKVLKLITTIAEKTNLLALNATIEAARAGEAGKGFAVVANEVKDLAKATRQATEEISQRIADIQSGANGAVNVIRSIGEIIMKIYDTSSAIAAAVEEQSATAASIAENMVQTSTGTSDIASTLMQVSQAADDTSSGANTCLAAAKELGATANRLQELVCAYHFDDQKLSHVGSGLLLKTSTIVSAPLTPA